MADDEELARDSVSGSVGGNRNGATAVSSGVRQNTSDRTSPRDFKKKNVMVCYGAGPTVPRWLLDTIASDTSPTRRLIDPTAEM